MAAVIFGAVYWFFSRFLFAPLRCLVVEVVVGKGTVGKVVRSMREFLPFGRGGLWTLVDRLFRNFRPAFCYGTGRMANVVGQHRRHEVAECVCRLYVQLAGQKLHV